MDEEQLGVVERFYIRKLMPEYNVLHNLAAEPKKVKACAKWEQTPIDHKQFPADLRAAIENLRRINGWFH
jgi:hypothetical protein